jgi:serine protease Do
MMRTGKRMSARSTLMALIIGGGVLAGVSFMGSGEAQGQQGGQSPSFAAPPSFADVFEQVSPAVVTVAVTMEPVVMRSSSGQSPFAGTPFEDFLDGFGFSGPESFQMPQPRRGEGSGFVIDEDGYIATNYHVVDGASQVTVTLQSGEQLPARVVGTDPRTDLALIKVDSRHNLPAVALGDSDRARIGEWVLAIGNPFGLGGTATAGIISARSRDINAGYYDDFLQIDAAINSGNSGGPVFNAAGQVIGINTAIFSPTGGSVGIGFAIPSNQARDVLAELRDDGEVNRGWLGISMRTDASGTIDGVIVDEVFLDGPADAAGIEPGDVITRFAGQDVDSTRRLARLVGELDAGDEVEIEIQRDGAQRRLTAELEQLDEARLQAAVPSVPESRSQRFGRRQPQQTEPFFRR